MKTKFLYSIGTLGIALLLMIPTLVIANAGIYRLSKTEDGRSRDEVMVDNKTEMEPQTVEVEEKVMPEKGKLVDGKCIITIFGEKYDVTSTFKLDGGGFFECGKDMSSEYKKNYGNDVAKIAGFLMTKPTTIIETAPTQRIVPTSIPTKASENSRPSRMEREGDDD